MVRKSDSGISRVYYLVRLFQTFDDAGFPEKKRRKNESRKQAKDRETHEVLDALDDICRGFNGFPFTPPTDHSCVSYDEDCVWEHMKEPIMEYGEGYIKQLTSQYIVGTSVVINHSVGFTSSMATEILCLGTHQDDRLVAAFKEFYRKGEVYESHIQGGERTPAGLTPEAQLEIDLPDQPS
jgi:hypothetical protein